MAFIEQVIDSATRNLDQEQPPRTSFTREEVRLLCAKHGTTLADFLRDHPAAPTYSVGTVSAWLGY